MISTMIERLIKEGEEEASHKAYCDTEMGKTKKKRAELEHDVETLTAKIDKAKATSAKLKEYYAKEGGASFIEVKHHQPAGPAGHTASSGAASGIIGMLEVVESDFSKNLAAAIAEHEQADVTYEKQSMENRVSKAIAEKDVKYKTKEAAGLDKSIADHSSDLEGVQSELDAILTYTKTLRAQCEIKPESYEERAARREAEISGLKEALAILEGEAVLLQQSHKSLQGTRGLRGTAPHKL